MSKIGLGTIIKFVSGAWLIMMGIGVISEVIKGLRK